MPFLPTDKREHWVERALRRTIDIHSHARFVGNAFVGFVFDKCVDWWMGYLNYQVIHHLWPLMPQHLQSRTEVHDAVKELAACVPELRLEYNVTSYWTAVYDMHANLSVIGEEYGDWRKHKEDGVVRPVAPSWRKNISKKSMLTPELAFMELCIQIGRILETNLFFDQAADFFDQFVPNTVIKFKHPSNYADMLPFMLPAYPLMAIATYLIAVSVGVYAMRSFTRFEAKSFALMHNTFLSLLSAYMGVRISVEAWKQNYGFWGSAVDSSESGVKMAELLWLFYFSKVFEFVDTLIMVAKKNNNQISFLHLYHHSSILVMWWFIMFAGPGGDAWLGAAVNSFIHVVMYGYYFLSALGFKQVTFIKKYITLMQMTQFCILLTQGLVASFVVDAYPRILAYSMVGYMVTMLVLFGNFYRKDRKRDKLRGVEKKKN
ncbi:Elongation of very long chain fatty acids protein 5 [Physocladia obscura]|uniref:Elongation of fatty acids protein n=1 Tax=Physocladia obscura TaxID=109957 RepID=A0AAD5SVU9_9FUNG|nr:Elongation of very long chain fatty acids protein 5 [Physocladia obscura]